MSTVQFRHKPFPLRVKHYPDEPAHALLLRTAAHNGTLRFTSVFKRCGIKFGRSVQLVEPALVAHLCSIDQEAVERASAVRTGDGVSVLDQVIRDEHLGGWWRRWCPSCLEEAPYHRVWWDISFLTSCPLHNVELVSDCGCGSLVHGRQGILRCNRNHELSKVEATPVDPAHLRAERYIVDRLLGIGEHPHPLLDKTSLGQAMQVLERIGVSALAEEKSIEDARAEFGVRALMSAGFDALSDFPRSFDKLLDQLIARREEKDLRNEPEAYGRLRYWMGAQLERGKRCTVIAELRAAITAHARANIISPNRMIAADRPVAGIPLATAAEECGLGPEVFAKLAKLGGLEIPTPKPRATALIAPQQLNAFKEWLTSLQTMEEVIETLGLPWMRVVEFVDQGYLPYVCRPYDRSEPKGKRGQTPSIRLRDRDWNTWYFEPGAADQFLARLRQMVKVDPKIPKSDLVEMGRASRMFVSFDQVVRLVLAGTLPLRGVDKSRPGLRGLLVSKSEAQRILKLERREGHPIKEAAPLLGMNYNQLRSCINTKLITPLGEGKALFITDEQIAEFNATYVRALDVAAVWKLKSSRLVIRYLREHGLEPLEVDGELGITLYRRDEAMPLAQSLPKPVVFKNSRDRIRYQKENDLPVEATRKSYDVSPDWNKRGNDRSGRKARGETA